MRREISEKYKNGNGVIALHKTKSYILTSVQSPCDGNYRPAWDNITSDPGANRDSYRYTRSLNERFHGTTLFEPGVFGYQQHTWYAALSNECAIFTNLPGGTVDTSPMRPGYWYGNGIFPAIRQEKNILGVIYNIPESYPIHFTHLYFPAARFDEYKRQGSWIFARKAKSWLGIWCSSPLEAHDDVLFGCEFRAWADKTAYMCFCGDETEDGSFEAFTAKCEGADIRFDYGRMLLCCGEDFTLRYAVHADNTQYI
jgi:hypothetical protein